MEHKKHPERSFKHVLALPFIYMMIFPMILLDFFLEIYHRICFFCYGIPYVKREDYIRIDRHKLNYLTFIEKINCVYCGYANGFAGYFVRIAADTEKYWCGIKHDNYKNFNAPKHHADFLEYGDEKAYKEKYCKLKKSN